MDAVKRNKLIGAGMLLPLAVFTAYIVFFTKLWILFGVGLLCGGLFYVGLKLVKGVAVNQLDDEIKEDIADARGRV